MIRNFEVLKTDKGLIKLWTRGVPVEDSAREQLRKLADMPFVYKHLAVMPDVHTGIGATVGSVLPTRGAIIPAAVGVDIGCGMLALQTSMVASDLPHSLKAVRSAIEAAVPHGRTPGPDKGAWADPPETQRQVWGACFAERFARIVDKHPKIAKSNHVVHLGTLGTGNHFIELCLDEKDRVWIMLHSGSRGVGGRIGSYFIELAKKEMQRYFINLPDEDLAYLPEGNRYFDDYIEAVSWAQDFAQQNRILMMQQVVAALNALECLPYFRADLMVVNCHHNYVAKENHFGANVFVTRKGAVRAREGDLGIIPGSMGARSFIVRGKGNPESFHSCSHGAGRVMSRHAARQQFTLADHELATAGVECRKDEDVLDETPGAYKDIDDVMAAQSDLVEIVHTLIQIVCVKG